MISWILGRNKRNKLGLKGPEEKSLCGNMLRSRPSRFLYVLLYHYLATVFISVTIPTATFSRSRLFYIATTCSGRRQQLMTSCLTSYVQFCHSKCFYSLRDHFDLGSNQYFILHFRKSKSAGQMPLFMILYGTIYTFT